MNDSALIVRDPNIRFGKPTVAGARITVADVLGWLAAGETIEDLLEEYPRLTREGILACLAESSLPASSDSVTDAKLTKSGNKIALCPKAEGDKTVED